MPRYESVVGFSRNSIEENRPVLESMAAAAIENTIRNLMLLGDLEKTATIWQRLNTPWILLKGSSFLLF